MNLKIIITLIFFFASALFGQESNTFLSREETEKEYYGKLPIDDGKMFAEEILPSNDTLLTTRTYGDHWFGIFAGPNVSILTGNVRWAGKPLAIDQGQYPNPEVDTIVDYSPTRVNADYNWFPGFIYEYSPVHWDFGFALRVFPYETVSYQAEYMVPENDPQYEFENQKWIFSSQVPFTGISPQLTYKIRYLNLKVWAGGDFFFSIGRDNTTLQSNYETITGQVEAPRVINNLENPPIRYGFNLGVEYEYLIMDIFSSTRVKFAPYAMTEWTTSYISDFGSSVSPIIVRAGFALKFGPDNTTIDTLKYVPRAKEQFIASFEGQKKVTFEGFLEREEIIASDLAYVEAAQVFANLSDEPELPVAEDLIQPQVNSTPDEIEEKLELKKGDKRTFTFRQKESTRPETDLRDFLDDLADWMKNNPNSEIRVVGHASSDEPYGRQQEISLDRAKRVQSNLQRKGINPSRILVDGAGSLEPIADNSTEAGRRKNRRVDITVVR